jgi:hypothetical protein
VLARRISPAVERAFVRVTAVAFKKQLDILTSAYSADGSSISCQFVLLFIRPKGVA